MKIISESKKTKISEQLLNLVEHTHLHLILLNEDLEFEFGKSMLNEKIGCTKNNEKFYLTLRDRFGNILEDLINEGLNLVTDLGLNEDNYRDNLDNIFENSNIFNGEFNQWSGAFPDTNSMELDTGQKNWWSRNGFN